MPNFVLTAPCNPSKSVDPRYLLGDDPWALHDMLDRIQNLVTGIREMSDNIAHDLKSPITHIRGIAEITLSNAQTPSEYEQMAAEAIGACDRLLDMINTMLAISESEAGVGRLNYETINLNQMLQEVLNPKPVMLEALGNSFKIGDKVMRDMCQQLIRELISQSMVLTLMLMKLWQL